MWDYMNMHGYFGGGFMWLWFLLIVLIVVLIVVPLLKNNESSQRNRAKEEALNILEKRFARGEISDDEYRSMKQTLEKD